MRVFPAEAAARARVLIVGDLMLDRYWFGDVERISPEAPVPVVRVARSEDRLGGAANVARNVVALGAQASLVGLVGDDVAGSDLRRLLADESIADHLLVDAAVPTTLKMRVLGRQQQLIRLDFEEAPTPRHVERLGRQVLEMIHQHDVLVLSDYAKGVLSQVEQLISAARQAGVPVLVDPKGETYTRYTGATLITPNQAEMRQAVGAWASEDELAQKAQALRRQLACEALLVTRSERGMSLFTEQGQQNVAADAHEVFDVSGAGDTVLAALAVSRAAGLDWFDSMYWANRAGGIVVGKLGTSVVTLGELT